MRDWLERYAAADHQRDISTKIVELLGQHAANSGPDPWQWRRDEVYDDRLGHDGG